MSYKRKESNMSLKQTQINNTHGLDNKFHKSYLVETNRKRHLDTVKEGNRPFYSLVRTHRGSCRSVPIKTDLVKTKHCLLNTRACTRTHVHIDFYDQLFVLTSEVYLKKSYSKKIK